MANDEQAGGMASDVVKVTGTPPERSVNRRILALAIPTFGQLIAEPAFALIDTAVVGHVGDSALAGLSVGSTIVLTVAGLCVFLAYGTTSAWRD